MDIKMEMTYSKEDIIELIKKDMESKGFEATDTPLFDIYNGPVGFYEETGTLFRGVKVKAKQVTK